VVIAHRPSALAGVDLVLMMADGKAQTFGPKDEVLNKVLRRPAGPAAAEAGQSPGGGGTLLKVVENQGAKA
jgi:ATP-binding cassette, subfamily C, bacterial PrsD